MHTPPPTWHQHLAGNRFARPAPTRRIDHPRLRVLARRPRAGVALTRLRPSVPLAQAPGTAEAPAACTRVVGARLRRLHRAARRRPLPAQREAVPVEARLFQEECGQLDWAAVQDWVCEPFMLKRTGLSVREHQRRTVASYLDLRSLAPEVPWVPVLQGWRPGIICGTRRPTRERVLTWQGCRSWAWAASAAGRDPGRGGVGSEARGGRARASCLRAQGLRAAGCRRVAGVGGLDGLVVPDPSRGPARRLRPRPLQQLPPLRPPLARPASGEPRVVASARRRRPERRQARPRVCRRAQGKRIAGCVTSDSKRWYPPRNKQRLYPEGGSP